MKKTMKKSKQFQARQGDVLVMAPLVPIKAGAEVPREQGRVILAHGEATGHAHAIREPGVCQLRQEGVSPYTLLRVDSDTAELRHEEHGQISIARGEYEVRRQCEWTLENEVRNVAD